MGFNKSLPLDFLSLFIKEQNNLTYEKFKIHKIDGMWSNLFYFL